MKIVFSILIANFNNSPFITEAIESVYAQSISLKNVEVLVCDDGSTDDSGKILIELQKKFNFKLFHNSLNLGVGVTKKMLIDASKGEWFIFLDSDDKLKFDCLETFLMHVEKSTSENIALIYANSIRLDVNGIVREWNRSKSFIGTVLDNKFKYPIFHPIIYNRKNYNSTEGIDINLKSADDFDLWYKMEEMGQIVFVNEPLYYYRINSNGVSQVGNDTNKWLQVMLEHAYSSANTAKRRGLDVRAQLNDFTEVIHKRLTHKENKSTFCRSFKMILRSFLGYYK